MSRLMVIEVCDIISQVRRRFEFTTTLHYINAVEAFPFINKSKLKTGLQVLNSREVLQSPSGACALLQFLLQNNLKTVFSETVALLKIILTILMTSVENERHFSSLKRIKSFLRNTMHQNHLN
ncbi:hypothetical protein PR048_024307 [Dryococelus australis]|uniref:HAT C-terminal dimerisation domain-containing protein n=1 Tax=Dryococelus australis TaxID=614101 RepID=A0ABQ9GNA5_9NEOP|nr:hypothetical protein PR048_024307 [Dryococelus australis]